MAVVAADTSHGMVHPKATQRTRHHEPLHNGGIQCHAALVEAIPALCPVRTAAGSHRVCYCSARPPAGTRQLAHNLHRRHRHSAGNGRVVVDARPRLRPRPLRGRQVRGLAVRGRPAQRQYRHSGIRR